MRLPTFDEGHSSGEEDRPSPGWINGGSAEGTPSLDAGEDKEPGVEAEVCNRRLINIRIEGDGDPNDEALVVHTEDSLNDDVMPEHHAAQFVKGQSRREDTGQLAPQTREQAAFAKLGLVCIENSWYWRQRHLRVVFGKFDCR